MKKLIALILICTLLVGCTSQINSEVSDTIPTENVTQSILSEEVPTFTGLDDTSLLNYIEDEVYENLVEKLNSEDYFVENVSTQYISKEYLEEVEYNSKENIYFGYTLSELDSCFQGKRYIFTSDDDGKTIVKEFEKYDDTYEQVIKNVAIGTGVILICVTVSAVSGGAGLPAMSAVFAVSAKTSAVMGLSSGIIGGVAAGLVTGIQTGNFEEAIKSGTLAGSNEFKWGAITGAIFGGASEAVGLKGATLNGLTMNEVASIQKESKYPLDVIKQFSNMEQYNICKKAGLSAEFVNGNVALIRKIDLNFVDEYGRTNLQRMLDGFAPLDPDGIPYELHHIGQKADSTLAILTQAEHRKNGNNKIWHKFGEETEVHGKGNKWNQQRAKFWTEFAQRAISTGGV
ncbi:HNH/ENDO VII family nuclease [Ruminococcus sp.]